jgi:hypothetical protein
VEQALRMSGESDKRPFDPNATIQLDALDGVQLEDAVPSEAAKAPGSAAPPPLPADAGAPPETARSPGRTLVVAALFVLLVAAAVAAGLAVGSRARPKVAETPAVTATAAAASSASGSASASASARTLTLPTIEIK